MAAFGVNWAVGFIAAAHRSYSGCLQYKLNVARAQQELRRAGIRPPEITFTGDWHTHEGFVTANADHVRLARQSLPVGLQATARLVFTAHSIPASMAREYPYERQVRESAERVARRLGVTDWAVVFQSRSGRPEDPWLGPDICDYLREEHGRGLRAVIVSPIGFVCDHIEVLYDLDREAAAVCAQLGIAMARASSVNDHPAFVQLMAEVVQRMCDTYKRGRPLRVAPITAPPQEMPPPRR
jgi:ferrochelatase